MELGLPDCKRKYGAIGEIVHTALQQILDFAPGFEGVFDESFLLLISHSDMSLTEFFRNTCENIFVCFAFDFNVLAFG